MASCPEANGDDANGPTCTPGSVPGFFAPSTAISLGDTLPWHSSGLPEDSASRVNILCLTLLRTRFTSRVVSPRPRWSLTPPFHPYPLRGGLLSVALSRGLLRVGVTHRPALRSPDVPRCGCPPRDRPVDPFARPVYDQSVLLLSRLRDPQIERDLDREPPKSRRVATAAASRTASAAASACS